jgi:hypothetical protein
VEQNGKLKNKLLNLKIVNLNCAGGCAQAERAGRQAGGRALAVAIISIFIWGGVDKCVLWLSFAQQKHNEKTVLRKSETRNLLPVSVIHLMATNKECIYAHHQK